MYDFYFGEREEVEKDPERFLLSIKRMLPRWCNSIPDSEFIALHRVLEKAELPEGATLVETGCGASTIILFFHALKKKGVLYTWDTNGSKLSFLRGLINDTILKVYEDQSTSKVWKSISYISTSKDAGIPIIGELGKRVDGCFLDSEHTWDNLGAEVQCLLPLLADRALVAIDDGNYDYRSTNVAFLNMVRKKLGLPPIADPEGNKTEPYFVEVEKVLSKTFSKVTHVDDDYKKTYQDDIYWAWYKADKEKAKELKMEKTDHLEHRFDAWVIER